MTDNPISVMLGVIILFIFSYGVILLFSFLYLKYFQKEKKLIFSKMSISAILVSVAWLASVFLSVWFASSVNLLVFAFFALLMFFGMTFGFSEKLFGLSGNHRIIFSLVLALILNPVWFPLLNMM